MARALFAILALLTAATALAQAGEPAPPTSDPVSFPAAGEDPPTLRGELSVPLRPSDEATVPGVVICHPHPLYGGTMDNPVVLEIRDRLLERGMAVLRFNFRGVGESTGKHDDGRGEVDDVLGALAFLRTRSTVDPKLCAVAGYSFGSQVALQACARDRKVRAAACIGYPTGLEEITLADFEHLSRVKQPLIFISGTQDQYSSLRNLFALIDHYGLHASVVPFEGVDHFFTDAGRRRMMGVQTAQFLESKLLGEI